MLTDQEVENVKAHISVSISQVITKLHRGFRRLEECPLKSFNSKKRDLRNSLIDDLDDLRNRIIDQL